MNLTLHTNRLILAPYAAGDLDHSVEMFTDPQVVKYAGGLMTVEEINRENLNWIKRGGDGCIGIWSISDRETSGKSGSFAVLPIPIKEDDTDYSLVVPGKMPDGDIEIGYFLKPSKWGHGYATEACKRLLEFAFQESALLEVVATLEEENTSSVNVLEKSGLTYRGMRRCYGETGPDYRITREEWLLLQRPD
jgi:ribosomal-protein-alanine N-acetyltransferase